MIWPVLRRLHAIKGFAKISEATTSAVIAVFTELRQIMSVCMHTPANTPGYNGLHPSFSFLMQKESLILIAFHAAKRAQESTLPIERCCKDYHKHAEILAKLRCRGFLVPCRCLQWCSLDQLRRDGITWYQTSSSDSRHRPGDSIR